MKQYNYNSLTFATTKREYFKYEDSSDVQSSLMKIKELIENDSLDHLYANYDDDDFGLEVYYENGKSIITITETYNQKCYNYLNPNYKGDTAIVAIAGEECPRESICEDKELLYQIIFVFLKSGKPAENIQWLETQY